MIPKKIFRSVSAAAIKQLQAKQKYGLAFHQPNLHLLKKVLKGINQFILKDFSVFINRLAMTDQHFSQTFLIRQIID